MFQIRLINYLSIYKHSIMMH